MTLVLNAKKAEIISFDLSNSLVKLRLLSMSGEVSSIHVCAFKNLEIIDRFEAKQALDKLFPNGDCVALVENIDNEMFATIYTPDNRNVNQFLINNNLAKELKCE